MDLKRRMTQSGFHFKRDDSVVLNGELLQRLEQETGSCFSFLSSLLDENGSVLILGL